MVVWQGKREIRQGHMVLGRQQEMGEQLGRDNKENCLLWIKISFRSWPISQNWMTINLIIHKFISWILSSRILEPREDHVIQRPLNTSNNNRTNKKKDKGIGKKRTFYHWVHKKKERIERRLLKAQKPKTKTKTPIFSKFLSSQVEGHSWMLLKSLESFHWIKVVTHHH